MVNSVIESFDRFGILPHTLPNAIGMWPNEQECLVWCALQSIPGYNWLEVGSFCGGSTVLLALAKQIHDKTSQVISVDNNFNPMFDYNVFTKGKFHKIVQKIQCNSCDILQHYNSPLGFVFLDGWHSFSAIINEFQLLEPLMSTDCIIGFHDVSPKMLDNNNKSYIKDCYDFGIKNWNNLMNSNQQDFRLDEAIAIICIQHGYEIINIPVRTKETHFQETRLTDWVRGETTPFNSFTAIRKIK